MDTILKKAQALEKALKMSENHFLITLRYYPKIGLTQFMSMVSFYRNSEH